MNIDRFGMLGVIFQRELAMDLVLFSLPDSYSQLIKDFYEREDDVILIDLTYLLIVVEAEMHKSISQENVFEGAVSQIPKDIDNSKIGSPKKVSLPYENGSTKVKFFDHMVKRKANSEIVPCAIPEESECFYCQLKGHWM
ncbi:hypothetical protein Lser_V15G21251 [Lactuca serriola]